MDKIKKTASYILDSFIGEENIISLDISEQEEAILVKVQVVPEAIGKLIGREGKTIKAVRNLLKIITHKELGKKVLVDVVKEGTEA